uniref:Ion transport-like peptide n=1 Tax=Carausius morosus TaxID=7022 RepID=A0A6G4ZW78_CARMO|nr:ion transport-like protein [Carausius morosus]
MYSQQSRTVIVMIVACVLVASTVAIPTSGMSVGHPLSKRSFFDIQCKGVYDKSIFARVDRICEDCYNLFREPTLHSLCRKNCFTSDYFKACVDVLLLQDDMEKIQAAIKQLHGGDPQV